MSPAPRLPARRRLRRRRCRRGLMTLTSGGEESASPSRLGGEILALLLFVPFLACLFSVLRNADGARGMAAGHDDGRRVCWPSR